VEVSRQIAEQLAPLLARIEALEAEIDRLRAQTARAGSADGLETAESSEAPAYDGQVRFLTDLGIPAYGEGGDWKQFSDDSVV
jgi:hypothetical protein